MAGKFKLIVMFVAVVSIFYFVLNIAGANSPLYANDSYTSKIKECYPGKGCDSPCCKYKAQYEKGGGDKIDEMMSLTRCAKKELLKEKFKANLEKKVGAKLDKVADLVVDAWLEEYRASKQVKGRRAALEASIREVFTKESEE
jgi:hypothetical protein